MNNPISDLQQLFISKYGDHSQPIAVRAPGRINLIGEHTDYNQGYVLPGAIDKGITFWVSPSKDKQVSIYAADFDEQISWKVGEEPQSHSNWIRYVFGVIEVFREKGYPVCGFNCVFGGDIPIGSGLSSSAALECGTGYCLKVLNSLSITPWQLALYCQEAEHRYVGVMCGIMDQFSSVHGKTGHVMRLDCKSLEFEYIPMMLNNYSMILCNTRVSHSLADSGYNTRRQQCEEGIRILQFLGEPVSSLRDVNREMLEQHQDHLDEVVYKRCYFIVHENQRVLEACHALVKGDFNYLGKLIYASHYGLQHEYEVSCPELDFLVDLTRENNAVLGARMVGGGFGGCTLNLVRTDLRKPFIDHMKQAYWDVYKIELPVYLVNLGEGAGLVNV